MILVEEQKIKEYTKNGWWGRDTLYDLFCRNVENNPDSVALADPPNRGDFAFGDPQRYTYGELKEQVDRLASSLLRAGLGYDDIVVVQLPNIAELIIVYLAAAAIGAIISPVPMQFRTHEFKYILSLINAKACVTMDQFDGFNHLSMITDMKEQFKSIKTIIGLGPSVPKHILSLQDMLDDKTDTARLDSQKREHPGDANGVFTICWTSGTEADPKGVPRSHNQWISISYAMVDGVPLADESRILNVFPLVAMAGIGGMLGPWLISGCRLVMHQPMNLPVFLRQIKEEQIHFTALPPVMLNAMLQNEDLLKMADLSSVKVIGSGSAPLSPWMVKGWQERDIVIMNIFASNEGTGLFSTGDTCPDPEDRARHFPRFGAQGFSWSNRITMGMETMIVDPETGDEIHEPGRAGELLVRGPTVFPGYYKRDDLTEKAFTKDGFYHSGDLFEIASSGTKNDRYRFVGRLKDLIIIGGFNVAPEELENLIMGHPKVAAVSVVAIPDRHGDRICAAIVTREKQKITVAELRDFLREKDIASYKIPKKVVLMEALPRNAMGKILKREIVSQISGEVDGT
jgi:acyl-CoA synthetase (AMP-forming)/AMP-acid ligase II